MADSVGMALFLADLVASNTAESEDHHDHPIHIGDGVFAIVSLETADIYRVTVEEAQAQLVTASNPPA